MPAIRDGFPDVCLLIAGDGSLRGDLDRLVETTGLTQSVRFLGWRHDIPEALAVADLLVLPPLGEPFGLLLLEAMALRKPVVGSAVGGMRNVVADGETGYLAPPADHAALAAKVMHLLSSPVTRTSMGDAGRRCVKKHFSLSAQISGTYALCRDSSDG
jgi:glycosyltransferase involved in cell wall biosynthesis